MRRFACYVGALTALGVVWAGSGEARARLGKRTLNRVERLGKARRSMTRDEARRALTDKRPDPADVTTTRIGWRKHVGKKEAIIQRLIHLMQSNVRLACPDSPKCPDYLFRLAELYNALRLNRWNAAMALHERIYRARAAGQGATATRLGRAQKKLFAASERYLKRALVQYVKITSERRFAGYQRMDEVIFSVGDIARVLAEQAGKRNDQAARAQYEKIMLQQFGRLIRFHPRSRFVPDALLAKGEHFFNNRQMQPAIRVYAKVARYPTAVGAYADYKIGWCYLNLKKHRLALAKFVQVAKGKRGGPELLKAARNDVVRAYSHIGLPGKAHRFFHGVALGRPQESQRMYLRLGTLYYAQGKNAESIQVFRDALTRWPRDARRCDWVIAIVDATINLGDKDKQVAAVRHMGRVTRSLTRQLGAGAPPVGRCRSATENTVKMLATQWHKEGLSTGNLDTLQRTKRLYQEYLRTYPRSGLIYLMTYQYADLLWVLATRSKAAAADWVRLAGLFTRIVKMKRPPGMRPKDYRERRNGAALASVRCWLNASGIEPGGKTRPGAPARAGRTCVRKRGRRCVRWSAPNYAQQPIPAAERTMLAAFATYIRYVRQSEHLAVILFNSCHVYWKHNHFTRALPLCLRVSTTQQRAAPRVARAAAYRVVGMLSVLKRHRVAERHIDRYLADKVLTADEEFVARMRDHKLRAMWARADHLRQQRRFAACGRAFEAMATRYAAASRQDTFFWNAGHCYERAGMLGPAVAMRRRLLQRHPRSRHAALAAYYVAGNFHNLAFFRDAARWYERFNGRWRNHREAPTALMWAIVLRGGLGDAKAMMKNAAAFIQRYRHRNRKLSAQAYWLVVKLHESLGDQERLLINLQRYAREYGAAGDVDKAIEAHARLAAMLWERSCKAAMIHGQCLKVRYYRRPGKRKKQKRIVYLKRDARLMKAARRHLGRAWAIWANGRALRRIPRGDPNRAEKVRNARQWAAYARFMQAEQRFEPYLKLRIPRRLDWDPRNRRRFARTVKRFESWIMTKLKTARALEKSYLGVVTGVRIREAGKLRGDPHWSIAAVARSGMIYHNFAELLLGIKPPSYLRTAAERDDFLAFIERIAKRFQDRAQAGYRACLKVSGTLRWFNEWSRVCEREINRLEPQRYPLANERRARPGYVAVRVGATGFELGQGGTR